MSPLQFNDIVGIEVQALVTVDVASREFGVVIQYYLLGWCSRIGWRVLVC